MHSEGNKKQITINDKAHKVIKNLFKSVLNRYQNNLEKSKEASEFVFNYVHLLHYEYHKINLVIYSWK